MSNPLISIIMPAYNAAPYIAEAIESIINQSYTNWELLIGDDCSTDNTKTVIQPYLSDERIKLFENEQNSSSPVTCNKLFRASKGEFITLLDADDMAAPERLQLQLNAFINNPTVGLVGTAYNIVDLQGNLIERVQKPLSNSEIRANITHKNTFCGATIMIRRKVYETVGGYREFFKNYSYQDYDWAYLISDHFECMNLPDYLYFYRQVPTSYSKKIIPKYYISDKLVQHLGKQRAERGEDDLQRGDYDSINKFIENLLVPFNQDPSLIYRKYAESFMYNRLHKAAINSAWQGLKKSPSKLVNYRTLFYCLRKSALAKMSK